MKDCRTAYRASLSRGIKAVEWSGTYLVGGLFPPLVEFRELDQLQYTARHRIHITGSGDAPAELAEKTAPVTEQATNTPHSGGATSVKSTGCSKRSFSSSAAASGRQDQDGCASD